MPKKRSEPFQVMASASTAKASRPASAKQVAVQFVLSDPKAGTVSVAGSFNKWDVNALSLKKKDKQGCWIAKTFLKPGRYEYLFVVDGQWRTDPKAKETVPNCFGSRNSVLEVG